MLRLSARLAGSDGCLAVLRKAGIRLSWRAFCKQVGVAIVFTRCDLPGMGNEGFVLLRHSRLGKFGPFLLLLVPCLVPRPDGLEALLGAEAHRHDVQDGSGGLSVFFCFCTYFAQPKKESISTVHSDDRLRENRSACAFMILSFSQATMFAKKTMCVCGAIVHKLVKKDLELA